MKISEMRLLSDEELKEISMRKNSKGNNTVEAERAMAIRRERCGHWDEIDKYERDCIVWDAKLIYDYD